MEQLPADDIPAIEEKLFGRPVEDNNPLLDFRMHLCHLVGLENRNADDETILQQCRAFLNEVAKEKATKERIRLANAAKAREPATSAARRKGPTGRTA
jgi:hypothetical protein